MYCCHTSAHGRLHAFLMLIAALPVAPLSAAPPAEVRTIALVGQPAPGVPGGSYSYIEGGTAKVNDRGQVAFTAQIAGSGITGLNNSGLWVSNSPTSQTLIARSGNRPPGLLAGVRF